MYEDKEIKEIDSQLYIPRLLYLRLTRREVLKTMSIISLFTNVAIFILGFIFLDSVYFTRNYIGQGDTFWDKFQVNGFQNNQIQTVCAFTSIYTILTSFLIITNDIVTFYHAHFGGLRKRLVLARWFNKVLQTLMFIYSIIAIAALKSIIVLFPIFIAFCVAGEISSLIIFIVSGKVTRKELDYMLPLQLMQLHKEEYYQDYLKKRKAVINLNNKALLDNESQKDCKQPNQDAENKILMSNN
jgi:hypothetical protein